MSGIEWPRVFDEALDLLVRYLRIDTSNPPGNEAPAARFLGAALEADGIPCEYIETAPGREILVARLPGDGSRRPLMLGNHLDVVPAEAEYWNLPPFEGVVRDGRVYGRGAVDMKGAGIMQLMTMLLLKRQAVPLTRDVVFCAVPDEEAAGAFGMQWLCRHRPDVVDVEFAINEGGSGVTDFAGRDARLFLVGTDEKEICWLRLVAVGPTGHGSLPHADNSAVRLMRALLNLADWERGLTFTPQTSALVAQIADADMLPSEGERAALESSLRSDPSAHAMFMNTLNVTMIDAGIKANIIPTRSDAVLDCRLLPGEGSDAWIERVRERVAVFGVSVERYIPREPAPPPAQWDTELYRVMRDVLTGAVEGAIVVPTLTTLGTDNRFLRERGIPSYGLIPCLLSAEERAGFHAHNEFLTVENLQMGCELMYEIVRRACA